MYFKFKNEFESLFVFKEALKMYEHLLHLISAVTMLPFSQHGDLVT